MYTVKNTKNPFVDFSQGVKPKPDAMECLVCTQ